MIALFAALELEVRPFLRRLDVRDRAPLGGYALTVGEYDGQRLLVCRTGMGRRAGEAADAVLGHYRPDAVLSVGLAGALSPEYVVGDLVFAETVHKADSEREDGRAPEAVLSDVSLLETARRAAESVGLCSWSGCSLTSSEVVPGPRQKAALRQATGLDVVEMESYWVGQAAKEQGLPFLAVRAVSDGAQDTFPIIPGVMAPAGEQRTHRALPYVLRHPGRIPLLVRTARAEMKAVANLTGFLEAFVAAFERSPVGKPA